MATKKKTADTAKTCEIRGVEFHVDMDVLDDFDVLDLIDEVMSGNPFKIKKLFAAIFKDEADKLFDLCRDENGRAKATEEFITEVFEAIGNSAKN